MKMFKKMAVLAAALMLLSVFVSCDNNAEEESGDGIVAVFNGYYAGKPLVSPDFPEPEPRAVKADEPVTKITFYDDNTFKAVAYVREAVALDNVSREVETTPLATGTYDGDPTKDGKVDVTIEKYAGMESGELEDVPAGKGDVTITIKDDSFLFLGFNFKRIEE